MTRTKRIEEIDPSHTESISGGLVYAYVAAFIADVEYIAFWIDVLNPS